MAVAKCNNHYKGCGFLLHEMVAKITGNLSLVVAATVALVNILYTADNGTWNTVFKSSWKPKSNVNPKPASLLQTQI